MMRCPSCSRESEAAGRFCPWCAAPLDATSAETALFSPPAATAPPATSSAVDEGRFLPGTMIAGRYRVASLLGRGGMGEVYRATDLTLGQAVALKFLPETASRDDRALARFYNEVRMARQVTHPNVCRVYDIGQIDGQHFISMEYVDGEDLSVLLRRIGRLPSDKAVEIARKLCAGLAAAHDKNVLHRDLKPANVMVDSRGQVIIMDFGLAGLTEALQADVRSGTPAYMSPEQLAGTGVSIQSDLYALGLVLYELFTGRRAFEAASLVELMEMQERATPASITTVAKDLDPAVERIVMRCLDPDPKQRPASALAIAAALPGGDPLAAALAAGETPSPELVAAAGETDGLKPSRALPLLAAALVGTLAIGIFGVRFFVTEKAPMETPPEALAVSARHLLQDFGYTAKPGDAVWGLDYDDAAQAWRTRRHKLDSGQPPLVIFWYRQSQYTMMARSRQNTMVNESDPPLNQTGMARVYTDSEGKLESLDVVPSEHLTESATPAPFDFARLFQASGLDPARFQSAKPEWVPLAPFDQRSAWTGSDARNGNPLRIEAAAWQGRPVYFRIRGPWSVPERGGEEPSGQQNAILFIVYPALIAACVLAWHNLRGGKADRRGAWKLGLVYGAAMAAASFLSAHHAIHIRELSLFWSAVENAGMNGFVLAAFYLALEPWVRKRWPHTLVSWSCLITRGPGDPQVGLSMLQGILFACGFATLKLLQLGLRGEPVFAMLYPLMGVKEALAGAFSAFQGSIFDPVFVLLLLFLIRVVVRKPWLTAACFIVLFGCATSAGTLAPWVDVPANLLFAAISAWMLIRYGLLVGIIANTLAEFLIGIPRTLDFSLWYAATGWMPIVLTVAIAIYGFRIALGGHKLLAPVE